MVILSNKRTEFSVCQHALNLSLVTKVLHLVLKLITYKEHQDDSQSGSRTIYCDQISWWCCWVLHCSTTRAAELQDAHQWEGNILYPDSVKRQSCDMSECLKRKGQVSPGAPQFPPIQHWSCWLIAPGSHHHWHWNRDHSAVELHGSEGLRLLPDGRKQAI